MGLLTFGRIGGKNMLKKLVLENFRQHRELVIDFTTGINIIRAMNEGGKSTLLESIGYALFGSKALRTTLDETVTWGEAVKTLNVALTVSVDGRDILFTRSKGGAEVVINGNVFVTGQNEVTAYASTMLGADSTIASKLMFASQNGIRGALEEGPKALSVLIEDLSDMAIFDKILESASEKLVLGSPALLEERLKGAETTLAVATEALPVQPDAVAFDELSRGSNAKIASIEASLATLEANAELTEKAWKEGSALYMAHVTLEGKVLVASDALANAKKQVEALAPAAATIITDSRPALLAEIAAAEGFQKRMTAYRIFKGLPEGERYSKGLKEFEVDAEANAKSIRALQTHLTGLERDIATLKARRINHDKCDKCGQDVTHLKTVIETNAAIDAEIVTVTAQQTEVKLKLEAEAICESRFNSIRRFASKIQADLMKLVGYVGFDDSTYPATAIWEGGGADYAVAPDPAAARAALAKVEAEIKALDAAKAKLELAEQQYTQAGHVHTQAGQALAAHVSPTPEEIIKMTDAKEKAGLDLNIANGDIIIAKREMAEATAAYDAAANLWLASQARIEDAKRVIAECNKDLEALVFNNALVKKLRGLRPIVANKVWNTVLASVSVMFSQMRGEASIVTKESSGFKVNGQSVESLSGSTLDVLGIALRCSLLRTFIPQCGLLVLDEPAQGCDESRTESMLGFLQSLGMTQTLLVTHETVSESVADNIIQL
jgi:DNA repair exonuclease SbcCD ATPase subunit